MLALIAVTSFVLFASAPAALAQAPDTLHADADLALGYRLLEAGDLSGAQEAFARAYEEDRPGASLGMARVAIAEEDWSDARRRLRDALEADPQLIEAHYWSGITHRELSKYQTFSQAAHRHTSEESFRRVLAADSGYRDVLYQYALLERYGDRHEQAIELGERQLRLRPDLDEARAGLFSIYRHYIRHTSPEDALAYLEASGAPTAKYFVAEVLRREGQLDAADERLEALLEALLQKGADVPVQPVLLSRARLLYNRNEPAEAESLIDEAIERIADRHDAGFVFDDFKYVIDDEELRQFETLKTSEELQAFLRQIWVRRDPTPARAYNARLAEHYRRLRVAERDYVYDGFRLWHNDPDRLGRFSFPATYSLNTEYNDKGLIYIRHGEPDDREFQVGAEMDARSVPSDIDPFYLPGEHFYAGGWLPNESWRFHEPEQMDFHFVLAEGGGANNWRLVPMLTHYEMLQSREHWGTKYHQLARAAEAMVRIQGSKVLQPDPSTFGVSALDQELTEEEAARVDSALGGRRLDVHLMDEHMRSVLEYQEMRDRLADESRRAVEIALQTDQHRWEEDVEPMEMAYVVSAFKGSDGGTDVEVDFALPLGRISEKAGRASTVEVEVGFSVHDEAWRPLAESSEVKRLPSSPDPSAASVDFYRFTVPPGRYHVSLLGNPVSTGQLGGYTFEYEAPDFSPPLLALSDVVLADFIGPARSGSRFDRGELHISPNPFLRFSNAQPVYVYFEIYHLTLGSDDRTNFSIEYVLKPEKPRPKFLGLFGGGERPAVTIREDQSGTELSPVENAAIDVASVEPGPYTLTVRVTDHVTGRSVERSRPLELYTFEQ